MASFKFIFLFLISNLILNLVTLCSGFLINTRQQVIVQIIKRRENKDSETTRDSYVFQIAVFSIYKHMNLFFKQQMVE